MNIKSLLDAINVMIEKLPTWNEDAIIYQYEDGTFTCSPRSTYNTVMYEHDITFVFECHDLNDIFPDFGNCENDAAWLLAQIIREQLVCPDISAAASTLGRIKSPKKAIASRENGKLGGRPQIYVTVHATPMFGGGFTLTDRSGLEMDNGIVYSSREDALQAAMTLWPDGKKVRNGWRIKNTWISQ